MSADFDATEFIDGDFQSRPSPHSGAGSGQLPRAPSREEIDSRVTETQQKLVELRRAQEELERERTALEETRRRQLEFQTGRQEMLQSLTRGVGLLEEGEFNARRDAEQMSKALTGLKDALAKIEAVHEEGWTQENFQLELTRALTAVENARMEWNAARLKFEVLAGVAADAQKQAAGPVSPPAALLMNSSFGELCRLGFALSWPVAGVILIGLVLLLVLQLRH
jgi:chromosome segregation ATPase